MKRQTFSPIERLVIWEAHGGRCFLCKRPVRLAELSIDHFFPRYLADYPARLARIQEKYALGSDFRLHDYMNCVPSHARCNVRKGNLIPRYSEALAWDLKKANTLSHVARKMHDGLVSWASHDKGLQRVLAGAKNRSITTSALHALIRRMIILHGLRKGTS